MPDLRRNLFLQSTNLEEINRVMMLLADRMDEMEGRRGTPTFYTAPDLQGNKITNVLQGETDSEALTASVEETDLEIVSSRLRVKVAETQALQRTTSGIGVKADGTYGLEIDPTLGLRAKVQDNGGLIINTTSGIYAEITENNMSLSDVTTYNASITMHGFCPKLDNSTSHFLRGDGSWALPFGYALNLVCGLWASPADSSTYYFGAMTVEPNATANRVSLYIPKGGVIKKAQVFWSAVTAGSGEDISMYIRLNDTTDTLIETVGNADAQKLFNNYGLSITVAEGDYIDIKITTPAWSVNPADVRLGGSIYLDQSAS